MAQGDALAAWRKGEPLTRAAGRDYLSQTEETIQAAARPRMTALGALSAVNRVRRLDRDRGN